MTIDKGTSISYAGTYTVNKDTRIATLPVGYADGFPRTQKNPQVFIYLLISRIFIFLI